MPVTGKRKDRRGGRKTLSLCVRSFPVISLHLLLMSKCFHGSLYARHAVIVKGFCYSRSPNLSQNLLRGKRPTYTKSKLEGRLIDFPDLIIYCAYRFEWFYFSQSGWRFRDFPLSLSHFKLECRCSLASKTFSRAQRQSSGPHTHSSSSSSNWPICSLDRPESLEQPASSACIALDPRVWHVQFSDSFSFLFWKPKSWHLGSDGRFRWGYETELSYWGN